MLKEGSMSMHVSELMSAKQFHVELHVVSFTFIDTKLASSIQWGEVVLVGADTAGQVKAYVR